MKSYKYIARDLSGVRREGLRQANCSNDVLSYLREQGFTPVSVTELCRSTDNKAKHVAVRKRIKSADLAALCWQLTTMVEGGIPITAALDTIGEDIENVQLEQVLHRVLEKMQKGETFSGSLAEFGSIFNNLARAIILAGETGGNLPEALRRLAEYFDNRDKLAKKVKGAMAYPAFVVVFIVLIVVFIMAFIIPRFRSIFDQIGGELPAFTKGFMSFYDLLRHNLVYILGALLLVVTLAILTYTKTKKGHLLFCKTALAMPLFGQILKQAFVTMFCKTMATLLAAGVSVLEVFDILMTMTTNDIIKSAIVRTREQIVEGSSISLSLGVSGFFPNMVVKMIQVGEESGSLAKVLDRTASYYERKVDATVSTLMGLLEPIMIVTVGGIVLVVVLALYLPIFSMSNVK
jgi:type IV pilus assembly protein PilC